MYHTPTKHGQQPPAGADLEERLRGMILNNTVPDGSPQPGLPPHMLMAGPTEQQAYMASVDSRVQQAQRQQAESMQPPPAGKKRLNQAQRRQMNAELSIPINPRSNASTQPGRGNASSGNFQQPGPSPRFNGHHAQNYQNHQTHQNLQSQQYSPRFPDNGHQPTYSPRSPYHQGHHSQQPPPMTQYNNQAHTQNHTSQHRNFSQSQQPSSGTGPASSYTRPQPQNRQIYHPGPPGGQGRMRTTGFGVSAEDIAIQGAQLERLALSHAHAFGIDVNEVAEKEAFRAVVEQACRDAISQYETEELGNTNFDFSTVELKCFGSMASGFATKASDMDLALLTSHTDPPADSPESVIPRLLEKRLLDMGFGARLLTRTRVPIIKLCQKPTEKLYADLVEERSKWENEFFDEDRDATSDTETTSKNNAPAVGPPKVDNEVKEGSPNIGTSSPGQTSCNINSKDQQLSTLVQRDEDPQNNGYLNMAKRILRNAGGRDISLGAPNLTNEEGLILNDVCKAFILGLKSGALSSRLQSYQSIKPLFDPSLPMLQRSLSGICTQIEGERLAMGFEVRPLSERDERREQECMKMIETWRTLQDESAAMATPIAYNRLLYLAMEKLKTISSLQLMHLQQLPHEEPIYYQKRAQKILDDLRNRDTQGRDSATPVVIAHYISGVGNDIIKDALRTSTQDQSTLQIVALQHRALQLAIDYEHALEKEFFEEAARHDVESYIDLLRDWVANGPANTTDKDNALIAKMRASKDPTTISKSKPRDKYKDNLEFPKSDVGIQCDVNFSAHLALHNTLLLRCYDHTDPRVKIMILFVKQWAKVRGINSSYRGTLSSYGYVLMVLHYLVNIAQPFVCPNLQLFNREPQEHLSKEEIEARTTCKGVDVRFWRDEAAILDLASRGLLNHNHDSIGMLIRGFFEYYAHGNMMSTGQSRGFDWGREVLSLRSPRGIISKQEKGWVGARTVIETATVAAPPTPTASVLPKDQVQERISPEGDPSTKPVKQKTIEETKEIRHRYLFAIEDPFELDHNVARTVTHNGIVSIRDEFRSAWATIRAIDGGHNNGDTLMIPHVPAATGGNLKELLDLIHGTETKIPGEQLRKF